MNPEFPIHQEVVDVGEGFKVESHKFLLGRSFKYLFILFYYYLVGC